ncbi:MULTISPECIES: Hpt domain-containing protein [Pseudoalteromonas]|uniref:Hpt domain-containing protein n=2 Tax=Pseudoalteromonas TaxID=53246 RepID=A0A063KKZ6_9GAMM|nr:MULTISPECIES: Hpt domain-containing protein [Pseudoalteromonas]ALQ07895.1 hypothetical protein D172_007390 [Pseudoalteromonas sp. Bsw20308]ATG77868.1 hypothetical protein AOR04_10160 [Pseudoalteromonas sp. 1_2015MBL_MicDiv]KAA1152834.1 Hpt domain-containing protein [Pseudoalteromonas fuliginea]KAA1159376.1 Hpt domain-containing protein [Pseudoalteromonas fuliginea]KAA1166438.1 Hpt domain-containing protein [Pseudoalteromonas fuliginea]
MIDLAVIEQLKNDIGDDTAVELLKFFVDESKKTMAIILNSNERDEIEINAHSLKSSCYSFGAIALGDTCKYIEELIKTEHSKKDLHNLLEIVEVQSKQTFNEMAFIIASNQDCSQS